MAHCGANFIPFRKSPGLMMQASIKNNEKNVKERIAEKFSSFYYTAFDQKLAQIKTARSDLAGKETENKAPDAGDVARKVVADQVPKY